MFLLRLVTCGMYNKQQKVFIYDIDFCTLTLRIYLSATDVWESYLEMIITLILINPHISSVYTYTGTT